MQRNHHRHNRRIPLPFRTPSWGNTSCWQRRLHSRPWQRSLSSLNFSQTTWTVKGTNIDSYEVAADASSASVNETVLSNPGLNTYWAYVQDGIPLTYKYCVEIPSVGNQCSKVANAIFNVTGPSATITPNPNSWGVPPPIACPEMMQFLYFGYPDPTSGCSHIPLVKGISFTAVLSNVPDSGGTAEWVQLVTKNILSGILLSGGPAEPTSLGTGLDNTYPYPPDDPNDAVTTSASDSPNNDLDPSLSRENPEIQGRHVLPVATPDCGLHFRASRIC